MPPLPDIVAPLSVLLILAAYLIGSLSGRRLLQRLHGPGSAAQPTSEGPAFAAARFALDAGKGALATWLALRHAPVGDLLSVTAHGYAAAFAAMLGHAWPLWHRFRGETGPAALVGVLVLLWPAAAALGTIAAVLAFLLSGHAGLAVVAGALVLPVIAWAAGAAPPRMGFAIAAALLLVLAHRGALVRLHAGTEPWFKRARLLRRWRRG